MLDTVTFAYFTSSSNMLYYKGVFDMNEERISVEKKIERLSKEEFVYSFIIITFDIDSIIMLLLSMFLIKVILTRIFLSILCHLSSFIFFYSFFVVVLNKDEIF